MRFVTMFSYGPNWQTGKTVYEQGSTDRGPPRVDAPPFDEGFLLLGGPFDDGGGIA